MAREKKYYYSGFPPLIEITNEVITGVHSFLPFLLCLPGSSLFAIVLNSRGIASCLRIQELLPKIVLVDPDVPVDVLAIAIDVERWRRLHVKDLLAQLLAGLVRIAIDDKKQHVFVVVGKELVLGFELLARFAEGEAHLQDDHALFLSHDLLELLHALHLVDHPAFVLGGYRRVHPWESEAKERVAFALLLRLGRGRVNVRQDVG
mmetsp:Transcript_4223/g.10874  ORF Transcript_4223/g.10874 Transcript_4223/m.10874 type:complete len:205 (+) Transcript_4223:559-1173(+)